MTVFKEHYSAQLPRSCVTPSVDYARVGISGFIEYIIVAFCFHEKATPPRTEPSMLRPTIGPNAHTTTKESPAFDDCICKGWGRKAEVILSSVAKYIYNNHYSSENDSHKKKEKKPHSICTH